MGKTKKELIEEKFNYMLKYANDIKCPFYDDIIKNYHIYDINKKVGLIERFIIPKKNNLEEYIKSEIEQLKIIYKLNGGDNINYINYELSNDQFNELIKCLKYIIKVIEY